MVRPKLLRCVMGLGLFCGTALYSHASLAQDAGVLRSTLNDVTDDSAGIDGASLPSPPPPIFSTSADEQRPRKLRPKDLDPYAPLGISDGAFTVLPSLEIGIETHSNVRLATTAPQRDAGLLLKPTLGFASNWSRHSLSGNVTGQWLRYGTVDDLSGFTGSAAVDLKLDVRRNIQAEFKANLAVTQTGPGSSSLPASAISSRTENTSIFSASLARDLGRAIVTSKIALARTTYGDVALSGGGTETNSDLNYYESSVSLRGSLGSYGSRLKPFAELTYAPRTHDQAFDRNGLARNSQGGSVALGVTLDDGPIWTGEMALTGNYRQYADLSLGGIFAVGFNGNLTWAPTPLDKATLRASLSQNETSNVELAATNEWIAELDVSHSVADNFQLMAGAALDLSDTGKGFEKTANVHGGFEYSLNREVATRLTVQQAWRVDGLGTGGYSDQSLIASLILRR